MISQILLKISKSIKQYSENHLTKSYYKTYMIQCCVKAINTLLYYQPVIFYGECEMGRRPSGHASWTTPVLTQYNEPYKEGALGTLDIFIATLWKITSFLQGEIGFRKLGMS